MNKRFKEWEFFGQSVWLNNISRDLLNHKELQFLMVDVGLKGVTSNPLFVIDIKCFFISSIY